MEIAVVLQPERGGSDIEEVDQIDSDGSRAADAIGRGLHETLNQENELTNVASVQALRTAARDACLIRKNYSCMTTAPQAPSANRQTIFSVFLFRIIDRRCAYSFSLSNVVIKRRPIFTKHARSARFISIFQRTLQNSHVAPKRTPSERVPPGQKLQEIGQLIAACELKNFVSIQRTFPPESVHP